MKPDDDVLKLISHGLRSCCFKFNCRCNEENRNKSKVINVPEEIMSLLFVQASIMKSKYGDYRIETQDLDDVIANYKTAKKLSGIPLRYNKSWFDNIVIDSANRDGIEKTRKYCEEISSCSSGIIFIGSEGTGKTLLATIIVKAALMNNFSAMFLDIKDAFAIWQKKSDFVTESDYRVINRMFSSDFLVLDDIGTGRHTEWTKNKTAHIVNSRYNDMKPIILTTNLPIANLSIVLDEFDAETHSTTRTMARLLSTCSYLTLSGNSRRSITNTR